MSQQHGHSPRGRAAASLVAALTSILASDAPAHARPAPSQAELSERVATVAQRIRQLAPTLGRDLAQQHKVVQWRN